MNASNQPDDYYAGCNLRLLRAVPDRARTILDVGCAEGRLGAALKRLRVNRTVFGIEGHPEAAARAAGSLDGVFQLDVAELDPPLEPGSIDCITFGDVLEHLIDPEAVLRRLRRFLAPGGHVIASIPNIQHHTILAALLRGDFQYAPAGLLDATHLRFFTSSTIVKLFLDAGFEPEFLDSIRIPAPPGLAGTLGPLLDRLGLSSVKVMPQMDVYQYIVRGRPLERWSVCDGEPGDARPRIGAGVACDGSKPGRSAATPLTFAVCVSEGAILQANLLASPCLLPGTPHEVILIRDAPDPASAMKRALERARHELVVCVREDVYLPLGWDRQVVDQYRLAETHFGPIGVAGVYGVRDVGDRMEGPPIAQRVGWACLRDRMRREGADLPARVDTLDEMLLIVRRDTPLRFDLEVGPHLYGADLCLQARERELAVAVLAAPCFHNSLDHDPPAISAPDARAFADKWRHRLPVATRRVMFDRGGRMDSPRDAESGEESGRARTGGAATESRGTSGQEDERDRGGSQTGQDDSREQKALPSDTGPRSNPASMGGNARSTAGLALSFVVCLSDESMYRANLLASPCLGPGSSHEVIAIRDAPSAAAGLSMGIARAKRELIICVHQDVHLPAGWDRLMLNQYRMAERRFGPIGVAGVYGVGPVADGPGGPAARRIGWVEDRGRVLSEGPGLPASVATLDELLLIVRRDSPLRFDPELGFHLYGADLCLKAREHGLAAVALGAPCRHRSRSVGLPGAFFDSARVFARKWAHRLPVATPCVVFDREGGVHVLGNADGRTGSVARGARITGVAHRGR